MRTQSIDTHPDAEQVLIELIKKAPLTKRFALMEAWTQFIIEAAKQEIRREHPDASEQEVSLLLLARQHGAELAGKVRAYLERRKQSQAEASEDVGIAES